jgi:hypothetical protein
MHGITVDAKVDVSRKDQARSMLREMVVPGARARAGFTAGYWLRATDSDVLRAVQIYDSEENARAAAERIQSEGPPPGAPVTLESVATYEVIAQA